ncbi:MAG TPA: interleukin-like EMT inducer domain-containing protein, partial [Anaerolineae bacterium]|nr:interleukin-like EMT inducer domain-containing protein [Anaerolineae bacterium]
DTHLDPGASLALAEFLRGVPGGYLVALAAADEASRLLGTEAVEALRGIGATRDLRERFRWGHAVVGVQGAAPGSAPEEMAWMGPARVVVGEAVARPEVAAALGTIEFEVAGP